MSGSYKAELWRAALKEQATSSTGGGTVNTVAPLNSGLKEIIINGQHWLKTGNVRTDTTNFPDALSIAYPVATGTVGPFEGVSTPKSIVRLADKYWITSNTYQATLREYSLDFTYTGRSINIPSGEYATHVCASSSSSNTQYVCAVVANVGKIYVYNAVTLGLVATHNIINYNSNTDGRRAVLVDNTTDVYHTSNSSSTTSTYYMYKNNTKIQLPSEVIHDACTALYIKDGVLYRMSVNYLQAFEITPTGLELLWIVKNGTVSLMSGSSDRLFTDNLITSKEHSILNVVGSPYTQYLAIQSVHTTGSTETQSGLAYYVRIK